MNSLNQDQKVRCSLDEPIQRLMEKLSTKSLELYTFWVLTSLFSKTTISSIIFTRKKSLKSKYSKHKSQTSKHNQWQIQPSSNCSKKDNSDSKNSLKI